MRTRNVSSVGTKKDCEDYCGSWGDNIVCSPDNDFTKPKDPEEPAYLEDISTVFDIKCSCATDGEALKYTFNSTEPRSSVWECIPATELV